MGERQGTPSRQERGHRGTLRAGMEGRNSARQIAPRPGRAGTRAREIREERAEDGRSSARGKSRDVEQSATGVGSSGKERAPRQQPAKGPEPRPRAMEGIETSGRAAGAHAEETARLGVWPTPLAVNGPVIVIVDMPPPPRSGALKMSSRPPVSADPPNHFVVPG